MPQTPPPGYPRLVPIRYYKDVAAALDFLVNAFGFTERHRLPGPDGELAHAELEYLGGVVMIGNPGPDYDPPKQTGRVNGLAMVYVDDVDAHYARARAAGATIVSELEETFYGDRRYVAADPAGQRWMFATNVKDVPPAEWDRWWEKGNG